MNSQCEGGYRNYKIVIKKKTGRDRLGWTLRFKKKTKEVGGGEKAKNRATKSVRRKKNLLLVVAV